MDAWNVTVQHQLTDTLSVEAAYVGNRGSNAFFGDNPATNANQPSIVGFANGVSTNLRRPFFAGNVANAQGFGGAYGWTQSFDYFCNCATNLYNSLQAKATKRFSQGYSLFAQYTLQHSENNDGDYYFIDPDVNRGTANFDRTHTFTISTVIEIPIGRGKAWATDVSPVVDAFIGGWQFNQNTVIQSGFPFNVSYRNSGQDRDTGPNRPNLIGDPDGPKTRDQWFNAAPIGDPNSAFSRPAIGTFGNLERNALRGPGYWRADASLFKNIPLSGATAARDPHRGGQHLQPREPRASPIPRSACPARPTRTPAASPRPRSATAIRSATSSSGCGWCFERARVRGENAHRRRMDALGC